MALSAQSRNALQAALANPGAYREIKAILEGETSGSITLGTDEDMVFAGATGTNEIQVADNLADALSVKITGGADFLVFDSTNSNEKLTILSAVTQKLGFWGTTPVVQPAHADQAALGAVTTVGSNTGTAAAGLSLIGDTTMSNQAAAIMNDLAALREDIAAAFVLLAAMRTGLVNLGIIKGAA